MYNMTKRLSTFSMILLILFFWGCTNSTNNNQITNKPLATLQEGDLLFQDLNCGELCDAIETVTEGVNGKDFSHCAMVVKINDTLKVVEAIGDKVQVNSIKNFFTRSGDTASIQNITVGRVLEKYQPLIAKAALKAKAHIGEPYDDVFLMNNHGWYCSELLYDAFKEANDSKEFFELNPMTFKDPKTKTFFPAWVDYYKQLNQDIPEGKPGINPGLISRSDKIEIVPIVPFNP
jgi:Permuted papain-like amidase enzyme, YaeF/YiiX, C92 family